MVLAARDSPSSRKPHAAIRPRVRASWSRWTSARRIRSRQAFANGEEFGRIDILVNNAAITKDGLALRMKKDDWDAVLATNLTGAFLAIQQVLQA